jgi:glycosyltransferase involved in cell wall biosynthesis
MISVLTPIFNGVEFLEECVDSVIAQDYQDWEMVIAVNGHGESGGEVAIVANKLAEKDARIRVLVMSTSGKVATMNAAVLECRGEWVCVLDADDILMPTKLSSQKKALDTFAAGASAISSRAQYFGASQGIPSISSGWVTFEANMRVNNVINSGSMIRRDLCVWSDEFFGLDDYHMWLELLYMGKKIHVLPEILVKHRIHPQSAFNASNRQRPDLLVKKYRDMLEQNHTTLVTAYFSLGNKSKFSDEHYYSWMQHFLGIQSPCVIHTDSASADRIRKMRGNLPTQYYLYDSVFDLPAGKYREEYIKQHALDAENKIHSPELYTVWNSKIALVEQATRENIFKSRYFAWFDIGSVRTPSAVLKRWPSLQKMKQAVGDDRILVGLIDSSLRSTKPMTDGTLVGNYVQGGFFAGTSESIAWYRKQFDTYHDMLLSRGCFVGKDQTIMNVIVSQHPEKIAVIPAYRCANMDRWFYFQHILSEEGEGYPDVPRYPFETF